MNISLVESFDPKPPGFWWNQAYGSGLCRFGRGPAERITEISGKLFFADV
jgi:hypothetical protein